MFHFIYFYYWSIDLTASSQLQHAGSLLHHADLLFWCMNSLVVVCELSCCWILVPRPGMEPPSPVCQSKFLTTVPPVKSQHIDILNIPVEVFLSFFLYCFCFLHCTQKELPNWIHCDVEMHCVISLWIFNRFLIFYPSHRLEITKANYISGFRSC